jgi:hypothetical protein
MIFGQKKMAVADVRMMTPGSAPVLIQNARYSKPLAGNGLQQQLGSSISALLTIAPADLEAPGALGEPQQAKKPHAHAGPQLTAFLQKLMFEEEQEEKQAKCRKELEKKAPLLPPAVSKPVAGANPKVPAFKRAVTFAPSAKPAAQKRAPQPASETPAKRVAAPASTPACPRTSLVPTPAAAPAKPRAKAADVDIAALDVGALHAAGSLSKLTIPQLKAVLKSHKLPVSGKKGELEQRLREHLEGGKVG